MPIDVASIPGSKWWKFDFHAHTPASLDHRDAPAPAPRDWVLSYMRAEIDCVAVTDHNSIGWFPLLVDARNSLEREGHPDYRPLVLFPGFELTVNGGFHILAIFDPEKGHEEVSRVIGACGYNGTPGKSDDVTHQSVQDVLNKIAQNGGIGIPAHVDDEKGLWAEEDAMTMSAIIKQECLYSVEKMNFGSLDPRQVADLKKELSCVVGSDCHRLSTIGSKFCWVKMAVPNKEGLRLALLDGELAVRRYDCFEGNPNYVHSEKYIERVEIEKAQYIGRVAPYVLRLNPWMNAIIGGRGTGKSSLLEFTRIGCMRSSEVMNAHERLADEFSKYLAVWGGQLQGGLCTDETVFRVYYRSIERLFRIQFSRNDQLHIVEEDDGDGNWVELPEQDIVSRFPIQVYSQKQVYHIAEHPQALRKIVDDSPAVDRIGWTESWEDTKSKLSVLSEQIRSISTSLEAEKRLQGELVDVSRKLALFENEENSDVLTAFKLAHKQIHEVRQWMGGFSEVPGAIKEAYDSIQPPVFKGESFDGDVDGDFIATAVSYDERFSRLHGQVKGLGEEAENLLQELKDSVEESAWKARQDVVVTQYKDLVERLKEQGVDDPEGYALLVDAKNEIEGRLTEFDKKREELRGLFEEQRLLMETIQGIRADLLDRRRAFLEQTIGGSDHVRIQVTPFGDVENAIATLRDVLRLEPDTFKEQILSEDKRSGLLSSLYDVDGRPVEDFVDQLNALRMHVKRVCFGDNEATIGMNGHFVNRLQRMNQRDLDALDCWYPEDALDVSYKSDVGRNWKSILHGSPGQKTAAILAFLLSYGTDPLLLDQPEDDLDNQLIFSLIVKQLIANKPRRQLIVVTHNPNIVVNGDSEYVVALESRRGQTQNISKGGLQEADVRTAICEIMEGGEKAFEKRYRRIIQT